MKKDIFEDATLINALMTMVDIYDLDVTREYILSGLPVDPIKPKLFDMDPKHARSLFTRAAKKAGFKSSLEQKPIHQIPNEVLPCVLLLGEDRACILLEFDEDMENVHIAVPGTTKPEGWISISELEKEYIGSLFLMKKELNFDIESKLEQVRNETESKHWFWSTLGRTKKIYMDIILGSLFINIFVLALPLYLRNIYDRVLPNTAFDTMWVLTYAIITIFILEGILKLLREYFMEIVAKKSDVIMSSIIFEHVLDMKFTDQMASIGKFSSQVKRYSDVRNFMASSVITTVIDIPFSILFLAVIYWVAGSLVFIPMITMGLIVLYAILMKGTIHKSIVDANKAMAVKDSILFESLNAIDTLKAFNYGNIMQWRMEEAVGNIAKKSLKSRMFNGSIMTVTTFLTRIQTVAIIVGSVYMIHSGELTQGGLLIAYILSSRAIMPVGKLVALILKYNKAIAGYKAIDRLMNMPVEHPKEKIFVSAKNIKGKIEFKHIDFVYPEEKQNVLHDISFKVEQGEHVAIMGEMGSGKSTLLHIIMGFFETKNGLLLLDDIEINQYAPTELRSKMAYVPQEVTLIKGTIKDNIALRDLGIDSHSVVEAAKTSGAIHYINRDPEGFNKKIKERGQNLSGGERQSIGIARAFLEDFSVALLDEPTSHLDSESEQIAIEGIRKKIKGKTTFIITHDKSLLTLVDRIIWMKDGRIVYDGKKEEVPELLLKERKGS